MTSRAVSVLGAGGGESARQPACTMSGRVMPRWIFVRCRRIVRVVVAVVAVVAVIGRLRAAVARGARTAYYKFSRVTRADANLENVLHTTRILYYCINGGKSSFLSPSRTLSFSCSPSTTTAAGPDVDTSLPSSPHHPKSPPPILSNHRRRSTLTYLCH